MIAETMSARQSVPDALRSRLQLSLGAFAELGAELAHENGLSVFAACTRGERAPLVITLHPPPPQGLDPLALKERVAQLGEISGGVFSSPVAAGEFDGRAWVAEPSLTAPPARDALRWGPLPMAQGVSVVRELARALSAIHRRGIAHGAVSLETVRITAAGVHLCGSGQSLGVSPRDDLDALAGVGWALLSGDLRMPPSRPLSHFRRGVPPALDVLFAAMFAEKAADRPQRAESILQTLDAIPSRRASLPGSIVDAGAHDGRPARGAALLVLGAAVIVMVAFMVLRS